MNCKKCNGELVNIHNISYACISCGETYPICEKTLIDKVFSLLGSSSKYIMSGFKNLTDTQKQERLNICESCDSMNKDNKTCNECGCYLDIKTGWATESCPLGKWNALPILENTQKKPCGGCNKQNKKSE